MKDPDRSAAHTPQYKAFHDVRAPCPESHLKERNEKMLCPKKEIDRDTEFFAIVQAFRDERALKASLSDEVFVLDYLLTL